jgi:uncharacterized membrane protein
MPRATKPVATVLGLVVSAAFVAFPLVGAPPVVRIAPILLFSAIVVALTSRPWAWTDADWAAVADWSPSPRVVRVAGVLLGLTLFWFVLTRFRSGGINAIDFTVYYDRPNFQTLLGHPLFIESGDDPVRAYRTYFAVHAHWIMLPMAAFYFLWPSPLWLLGLSVLAVVAGAIYIFRIVQHSGAGGPLASASALAFALNDNTARTLNYGFHTEVLYAWFVPWLIYAGLSRRWKQFAMAAVLCISVKEDAFLVLLAVGVALLLVGGERLTRFERFVYVPAPIAFALLNLAVYFGAIVPRLSATGAPFYANYWGNFGPTTTSAAVGMLLHPLLVASLVLRSGFWTQVITPHLYLPLAGWRWSVGALPVVVLYGASANDQLRSFGIYYAIVLVPFLVLGAASGASWLAERVRTHRHMARVIAAAAVAAGSLLPSISTGGYSLRPWRPETAEVATVLQQLKDEPAVLVQSGLYPHAGYESRVQLLTKESLGDDRYAGAAIVLAPALSAYPMDDSPELKTLTERPTIRSPANGVIVVRNPVSREP